MRPPVENHDHVYQQTGPSESPTNSRSAERGSRQAMQIRPDNSDGMVSPPRGVSSNLQQVAPSPDRPLYNKIQTSPVCATSTRLPGLGNQCTQPAMGGSEPICLPTSSHIGQNGGEVAELSMQENHSDCPRLAKHILVLGSSEDVQPHTYVSTQPDQSALSAFQPDSSQEFFKSESAHMAPTASAIKEQGFSEAVAARIEVPER